MVDDGIPEDICADLPIAPLPVVTAETAPFWESGRAGRLMIARCQACGLYLHPPQPICRDCLSDRVKAEPVSGRAVVASYTINHQPWTPDMKVPFALAVVDLAEQPGLRLTTCIVGTPLDRVAIGLPVVVCFCRRDDVWLPVFREDRLAGPATP